MSEWDDFDWTSTDPTSGSTKIEEKESNVPQAANFSDVSLPNYGDYTAEPIPVVEEKKSVDTSLANLSVGSSFVPHRDVYSADKPSTCEVVYYSSPRQTVYPNETFSQKLQTLESEIIGMLTENPEPTNLRHKISEMVRIVDGIFKNFGELFQKWDTKLTFIMRKFFSPGGVVLDSESIITVNNDDWNLRREKVFVEIPKQVSPEKFDAVTGQSSLSEVNMSHYGDYSAEPISDVNNNYPSTNEPENDGSYCQQYTENDYSNYPQNESAAPDAPQMCELAQELFAKMKSAFDNLRPLRDDSDVRGLQMLLPWVARARKTIDSFYGDRTGLYQEVYGLMLSKFPTDLQSLAPANNNYNLFALIQFLCNHLRTVLEETFAKRELTDLDLLFSCTFCKMEGHSSNLCPRIKSMFCLNCFRFGHQQGRCYNAEIRAEDIRF